METDVTRRWFPVAVTAPLVLALWIVGAGVGLAAETADGTKDLTVALQYQNYFAYEGIETLGIWGFVNGPTPPVSDWVTTHCRYIDVPNAPAGEYYLRYPVHLPQNAAIKGVELFLADFNPVGNMSALLMTRPWNSRDVGTQLGFTATDNATNSDKLVNMGLLDVTVDNQSNVYWIDVSPRTSSVPGDLCVYGIQVKYDCAACVLFEDGFESGNTAAWSGAQ